ncbi:MAG TPA: ATP-binding protein [Burkholderiales bacterium]|nr:ATP-binding protein [Burkholderiales bacterium]
MNTVVILWAAVGGTALTLAGVHGFLWLLDRRKSANLAFCVVAVSVAGISMTELGMMHSVSPAEYGAWVRWFHAPNYLAILGLIAFVRLEFGSGRLWLATSIVTLRTLLLALNFTLRPNANWSEITSLRTVTFLGEQVSVVGNAVVQPFQWVATVANLLFIAYVADAFIQTLRAGSPEQRRKALVIYGGILAFLAAAILEAQLVVWGAVRMPVVIGPPFLILMVAITYEISREIVGSTRTALEAQRLRNDLAHVARVNTISQLSASLAHEINQPLTSILLNAQAGQKILAAEKPDLDEIRAILADIGTDDRRAATIIDRARELLRNRDVQPDAVSLQAIAKDVLALVRTDAIDRRINLEAHFPDDIPPVRGDPVQLSQVLLNLVVNALDAVSVRSDREQRIRVVARSISGNQVEVAVTDSGTGIPAALLPRIFESFVTTKPAGLGIGLSVASDIVVRHGGRLWAENNPEGGATFRFTLPTAPA